MKKYSSLLFLFLFVACSEQPNSDVWELRPTNDILEYVIDEDVHIPLHNLYTFENNGTEYLTFPDNVTRTILIYNLDTGDLVKKIKFESEGANGIGVNIWGYLLKDFQNIYIPDMHRSVIYETDTTGQIRKTIEYPKTDEGLLTLPAYYTNHDNVQMFFMGDSLYIPQRLNRNIGMDSWVEKSPTSVIIDTLMQKTTHMKMFHPYQGKITSKKYGSYIADLSYSLVCREKNIIYSFTMEDELYKVDLETGQVETIMAKSRYISKVRPVKIPSDFNQMVKKTCEMPSYGNIFYDKYRKVYYRFACPATELDNDINHLSVLHSGKKEFSIIVLDEEFNVMCETKFPPFTYVPHICFIKEDGLYLSASHFMRKDYSDDRLRFQRIELVKNK